MFEWLFDTTSFPARWNCGRWDSLTGWIFIIADLLIFAAYYAIPFLLLRITFAKLKEIGSKFKALLICFAIFILACGSGHLVDALMFYYPAYRILMLNHIITALVSWTTIVILYHRLPYLLALKDPEKLSVMATQLQSIIDTAFNGFISIDAYGNIVEWNKQSEKLFGWSKAEIMGKNISEYIIPLRYREKHREGLRHFLETGESVVINKRMELAALNREGNELPVEITIWTNKIEGKDFFYAFIHDISHEKKIEIIKNQLVLIVESTDDAIISKNMDGIIVSWNGGAERMFGYSAVEAIGMPMKLIFPDDKKEEEKKILTCLKEGKSQKFETTRKIKDGSLIDVMLTICPLFSPDGEILGGSAIAKNITEYKNLEKELIEKNKELEQFSYIASHDLKAPLRGIATVLSWLQEDVENISDKSKEYVNVINGRVKYMENLIDALLEYSRIGRTKAEKEILDFNLLLKDVVGSLDSTEFNIEISELPTVKASRSRMMQVFSNLINNSIKHNDKEICNIKVFCQKDGKNYKFCVEDDGPGIDPRFHEKVFAIFQTLKPKYGTESTGIGLTLVKKIIEEEHQGKIWIESEGRGTKMYFTIPKED